MASSSARRSPAAAEASSRPNAQSPPPPMFSVQREVGVVKGSKRSSEKACNAPVSISSAICAPVDWAELLDSLLHEIIGLFTSYHDLLRFASTCRSWRAAFSSCPSKFKVAFPFLVLQPDRLPSPYYPYDDNFSKTKWQLIDPTNPSSSIRCAARMYHTFLDNMDFVGCSQGYLIFSSSEQCLLVDVITGAKIRPPQLPYPYKSVIDCAILTAPLSLPNTHLLVSTKFSLFQWRVGSHAWSEHCLCNENIRQIVVFQGQIFAMNSLSRICSVHLGQQPCVEDVAVASQWESIKVMGVHYRPWLVVCGDMLLVVTLILDYGHTRARFEVFCLDLSVKPAMLVKVDKLENWALFVGTDMRSPTFAGMNPERWGGKSNYLYVAGSFKDSTEPWFAIQLGEASRHMEEELYCRCSGNGMWTGIFRNSMQPLWVIPMQQT
ncbi:uncharacterized protein LOC124680927 [Lolium rigidum]|uniref:uncharacterized protein LOC124680927 n=1 Tax=Lolium rigidum TaxID=89674 RepID=UPI001F5D0247|nr:uncharacterized protein LOC124680927 [Lolium rigidum]